MKKKILVAAAILVLLLVVVGSAWYLLSHVFLDGMVYAKNADVLDLRGTEISVEHYEKLRSKLPGCHILWDVPFQGSYYPEDTLELTITSLEEEDVMLLDYLQKLERIDARDCTDYAQLTALQERRPDLQVSYIVTVGGEDYPQNTEELSLSDIAPEEIELLQYLPQLTEVNVEGGKDGQTLAALQQACAQRQIALTVEICGERYPDTTKKLTVTEMPEDAFALLSCLPELTSVHIVDPKAKAEALLALQEALPEVEISWEREIAGVMFSSDAEEIDISGAQIESIGKIEDAMAYFPNAKKLVMCDMELDNEEMAAFRERARENYKVVWTVVCGKLTARTDDTIFMPVKYNVYYFLDSEAYNLRYCEDMVCIDVGHMAITNVDWVAFMPHLKYLILAHTQIRDITPLSNCKELIFLELDHSPITDFTPLQGCTALEDLNIGNTYADPEPVTHMTWLKHLWYVQRGGRAVYLTTALPDTQQYWAGMVTVGGGWRKLQNYYDMRDMLGMHYMTG